MIDELCDRAMDRKIAVAYFYCDFQSQEMQTPGDVLGALVKQIVCGSGAIPAEIDEAFRKAMGQVGGRGLRVPEALELLKAALAPLDRAFICIDALDELLEKHLPQILRSLHTISQSLPMIRFFFTGRPHIGVGINKYFPGAAQFLQIKPTREDIVRYVEMVLDDDCLHEAMDPSLREEIIDRVSETVSDVYVTTISRLSLVGSLTVAPRFLLVSLNITAILDETTIYQRREQLKRMTDGRSLGDAYSATLDRIKQSGGKSRLAMAALMWISKSERPMSADELCHALGVQVGSTKHNPDNIPSIQSLLASCLGLVTVDREESAVRLVHFTLQEYLNSRSGMFQNPYAVMAEVCLTYLNFDCIRELSPVSDDAPQKYPFLEHASNYWGYYARSETTDGVKSLGLQLLGGFDSHISAVLFLRQRRDELAWQVVGLPKGFTGLHCAAYLGIDEIAEALLDMKAWDIDKADFVGRTPLIWASKNGCEGIIRLLLEKAGANLHTEDARNGQTPLAWAARYGQEGAVRLLLERGEVNPESRDKRGRTPLSLAAESGYDGVLRLLLEREEVDPESRDNGDQTPLFWAARYGQEGAVKLLLERGDVNPESRDNLDRTPLSLAAESGYEGVLRLLLRREGVNPQSRDNCDRTPLSWAAGSGEVGSVELLLELDEVDPESADYSGRTALSYGAEEVVELLLGRVGVDPESRDSFGRTPLSRAAGNGDYGVVQLLLEQEVVDPESRDDSGRTPLSHAAGGWCEDILELLLERGEVDPESRDNNGRTPFSWAAQCGREGVAKQLLAWAKVNPESRDDDGRTPLSWAAGGGGEAAVELLLGLKHVNPDSQDNCGRTPLSYAAGIRWSEGVQVIKSLLQRDKVDPGSRDNSGRTPLSYAASVYGGEGAVKLFLGQELVNPDSRDNSGRTPLSYAAGVLDVRTLRLLLEQEKVDPESRDNCGQGSE